jgi:hypothetical protein
VYRVRQVTLTSEDEIVTERAGASLLSEGITWPLTAERTAVLWLFNG